MFTRISLHLDHYEWHVHHSLHFSSIIVAIRVLKKNESHKYSVESRF